MRMLLAGLVLGIVLTLAVVRLWPGMLIHAARTPAQTRPLPQAVTVTAYPARCRQSFGFLAIGCTITGPARTVFGPKDRVYLAFNFRHPVATGTTIRLLAEGTSVMDLPVPFHRLSDTRLDYPGYTACSLDLDPWTPGAPRYQVALDKQVVGTLTLNIRPHIALPSCV